MPQDKLTQYIYSESNSKELERIFDSLKQEKGLDVVILKNDDELERFKAEQLNTLENDESVAPLIVINDKAKYEPFYMDPCPLDFKLPEINYPQAIKPSGQESRRERRKKERELKKKKH